MPHTGDIAPVQGRRRRRDAAWNNGRRTRVQPSRRQGLERGAFPPPREEAAHGSDDQRHGAGLHGRLDRRRDQLPRVDRRLVGGALLASQGLHARVHDRARLHGEDQARVRQAQREDHRHLGRLDRRPRGLGEGHRGDPGRGAQLSDHRRRRLQGLEAVRDAPGRGRGRRRRRARLPTTRPCGTSSWSVRTRRSSSSSSTR